MPKIIYVYLLTTAIFFAVDIVWLGLVAKNFYRQNLSHLMAAEVNWAAAVLFYALYIAGIIVFAVHPAVKEGSVMKAFALGAFLGLLAYGTYDLTNLATLREWPLVVTVVDLVWGTVLTGTVAVGGYWIARALGWPSS